MFKPWGAATVDDLPVVKRDARRTDRCDKIDTCLSSGADDKSVASQARGTSGVYFSGFQFDATEFNTQFLLHLDLSQARSGAAGILGRGMRMIVPATAAFSEEGLRAE